MARGDHRPAAGRTSSSAGARRAPSLMHAGPTGLTVRRLAIGTLAFTGAAVTVLSPAHALTVGEIAVESALGQPLDARVPVTLGAGEALGSGCVTSQPAGSAGLTAVPGAAMTLPEATVPGLYDLRVTTSRALYEPMYELNLQLRCPGAAVIVRQFVLMLDLPGAVPPPAATVRQATEARTARDVAPPQPAAAATPQVATARPSRRTGGGEPITAGSVYRVRSGDTLSTIAERIRDRGGASIWQTADRIFAANPGAFIGADPDRIRLGAEIVLPGSLDATTAPSSAVDAGAAAEPPLAPAVPSSVPAAAMPAPGAPLPAAPVDEATATVTSTAADVAPAPTTESAPAVATEAVFEDEQATVIEAEDALAPASAAVAAPPSAAEDSGAPPWLAAVIGMLLGAGASLVLLRERLIDALRGRTPAEPLAVPALVTPRPPPVERKFAPREPSMVVVEEPRLAAADERAADSAPTDRQPAPALAEDPATAEMQSELAQLFGAEPDVPLFEVPGPAASAQPGEQSLDLDLSSAAPDTPVDQDIGWLDDMEVTALTPTDKAGALRGSGGDTVEQLDLQTLAQKATDDRLISDTLKEALELLENDYEDELTASQVVDRAKLGQFLDHSDEDDTLVRTGTDQIPRR